MLLISNLPTKQQSQELRTGVMPKERYAPSCFRVQALFYHILSCLIIVALIVLGYSGYESLTLGANSLQCVWILWYGKILQHSGNSSRFCRLLIADPAKTALKFLPSRSNFTFIQDSIVDIVLTAGGKQHIPLPFLIQVSIRHVLGPISPAYTYTVLWISHVPCTP